MPNLVGLSLCTGYGGLDLAAEAHLDVATIAVADNDPAASKLLTHRFPYAPNLGDITTAPWHLWADVDLITAGYPCQPFSHAGRQKGLTDERHIFPHIAQAIRQIRPRLVLLENVRGHLAIGFAEVNSELANLGYDTRWVCLPASGVGAPHKRNRLFIAAAPRNTHGTGLEGWDTPTRRANQRPPRPPDMATANTSGQRHGRQQDTRMVGGVGPPTESIRRATRTPRQELGHRGTETPRDPDRQSGNQRGEPTRGQEESGPTRADTRGPARAHAWGPYAYAIDRWAAIVGRAAPPPTVGDRLNPRLVEWMMGLPDGWVCDVPGLTRKQQLKLLGNGVVPQQAIAALETMGVTA